MLYSTRVQQRVCIQAHHGVPLRTTEGTLTCPTLRLTRGCQYLGVKGSRVQIPPSRLVRGIFRSEFREPIGEPMGSRTRAKSAWRPSSSECGRRPSRALAERGRISCRKTISVTQARFLQLPRADALLRRILIRAATLFLRLVTIVTVSRNQGRDAIYAMHARWLTEALGCGPR